MAGKDGGWLLPAVNDPLERTPVCICVPDEENHVAAFWGALQELGYWFNWKRDTGHNALPVSILWNEIVNEAHQKWLDGVMCTSCEELIACLQPLIDDLSAQIAAVQTTVDATNTLLEAQTASQRVQAPMPYVDPSCDEGHIYSGALAVVDAMNEKIIDLYEQAEISGTDTRGEYLGFLISAIPAFETLPIDEMFEFVDYLFENQQAEYEAAVTETWKHDAACLLKCAIEGADCTVSYSLIGNWLSSLRAEFPSNIAADLYARFGDAMTPTLANQIGQFYQQLVGNNQGSLEDFFRGLINQYAVGAQLTNPGYIDCDTCGPAPNISLINTYPALDSAPVFVENTPGGGSIWECTYVFASGQYSCSVTPQIGGSNVCCILNSADPVVSYQHFPCGGGIVSGSGDGSGSAEYSALGWYGAGAGTLLIEIEPVP